MEDLGLKKLKLLTGDGLKTMTSKTLTTVNLQESASIVDSSIICLVQNCPNISVLNLSELHKITDGAIIKVAEHLSDKLVCNNVACLELNFYTLAQFLHCH